VPFYIFDAQDSEHRWIKVEVEAESEGDAVTKLWAHGYFSPSVSAKEGATEEPISILLSIVVVLLGLFLMTRGIWSGIDGLNKASIGLVVGGLVIVAWGVIKWGRITWDRPGPFYIFDAQDSEHRWIKIEVEAESEEDAVAKLRAAGCLSLSLIAKETERPISILPSIVVISLGLFLMTLGIWKCIYDGLNEASIGLVIGGLVLVAWGVIRWGRITWDSVVSSHYRW
jgi:hypothetical protein